MLSVTPQARAGRTGGVHPPGCVKRRKSWRQTSREQKSKVKIQKPLERPLSSLGGGQEGVGSSLQSRKMILKELQQFFAQHKKVSLADLQLHFRIDADALRGMLNRLIRKGRIRKMEDSKKCGGCHSCADEAIEFYEWVNTDESFAKPLSES